MYIRRAIRIGLSYGILFLIIGLIVGYLIGQNYPNLFAQWFVTSPSVWANIS